MGGGGGRETLPPINCQLPRFLRVGVSSTASTCGELNFDCNELYALALKVEQITRKYESDIILSGVEKQGQTERINECYFFFKIVKWLCKQQERYIINNTSYSE